MSPCIGLSYLDLNQEVEGSTRPRDAFPDGDDLDLRYRACISNTGKFSGMISFNLGSIQEILVAGEYNFSPNSDRFVDPTTYRF